MDEKPTTSRKSQPSPADSAHSASSPEWLAAEALEKAAHVLQTISAETGAAPESRRVDLPDFGASAQAAPSAAALGLLDDVTLRVKIELGRTQMYVEDVLRLNASSVVELDK